MCLQKVSRVYIAKEDIIVYKHVIKCTDGFVSSYQKTEVQLDKLYTSDIRLNVDDRTNARFIEKALHSFVNLAIARVEAQHWREVLVECVIPKGSRYHKGEFDGITFVQSIASNQLIHVKVLDDYYPEGKGVFPINTYLDRSYSV